MTLEAHVPQTGAELRSLVRTGRYCQPTSGVAPDHVQMNVAILPKSVAFEFLLFCQRNPKPCPVIEVIEAGEVEAKLSAPGSDIRTDVPMYRVYKNGEMVDEPNDLGGCWRDDLVTFLLGCSFSFEHALMRNGISLPYFGTKRNVPMFTTSIQTVPAGPFAGPLVVSQRWVHQHKVVRAVQATSRFPAMHGAPVHVGSGAVLGIKDELQPDFGDPWVPEDESLIPVYWACGVTPQAIAIASKIELMITHAPGHMFVTDLMDEELAVI